MTTILNQLQIFMLPHRSWAASSMGLTTDSFHSDSLTSATQQPNRHTLGYLDPSTTFRLWMQCMESDIPESLGRKEITPIRNVLDVKPPPTSYGVNFDQWQRENFPPSHLLRTHWDFTLQHFRKSRQTYWVDCCISLWVLIHSSQHHHASLELPPIFSCLKFSFSSSSSTWAYTSQLKYWHLNPSFRLFSQEPRLCYLTNLLQVLLVHSIIVGVWPNVIFLVHGIRHGTKPGHVIWWVTSSGPQYCQKLFLVILIFDSLGRELIQLCQ